GGFIAGVVTAKDDAGRPAHKVAPGSRLQGLRIDRQRRVDRLYGARDRLVVMGVADHQRGHQHAASDRLLKEEGTIGLRRLALRIEAGESQAAIAPDDPEILLHTLASGCFANALSELLPLPIKMFDHG